MNGISTLIASSTLRMAVRFTLSTVVLVACLYALAWVVKRRRPSLLNRFRKAPITVLHKVSLSRRSSAALLSVGTETFLIGVTESNVTLLGTGDSLIAPEPEPVPDAQKPPSKNSSFTDALSDALRNMGSKK